MHFTTGSPGHRINDFGRVGSSHGSVCQTQCLTRFWVLTCAFIVVLFLQSTVTPSRQTNICGFGFGSVPVTSLLVYLCQLVTVIFTYLRADCPCSVTTFLVLTSFRLLTGLGRVGSVVTGSKAIRSGRVTGQKSWPSSISAESTLKVSKLNTGKKQESYREHSCGSLTFSSTVVCSFINSWPLASAADVSSVIFEFSSSIFPG